MSRCRDPTALPFGVFCMILSLRVREQYARPQAHPLAPRKGEKEQKRKKPLADPSSTRLQCKGFEYPDVQKQAPISRLT